MYDQPDSVVAQLARRGAADIYSDWILVQFDSYNDNRTAFAFGVNPRGVKRDLRMFEGAPDDPNWDAVWEVATEVDSLGWTAEFRIPLSQLRYSPAATTWGVNFQREVARNDEVALWSPTPPTAPAIVPLFGTLTGLEGLASPARLEFEPYAVSRLTQAPGDSGDPFHSANQLSTSAGMDLQYGLGSSLTLTGTINPDFGQVEADPSVVNLTAFETFFEDRRPFFVEGSDLFEFNLGLAGDELFYSRRIGRTPQGTPPGDALFSDVPEAATILGAMKLSGRTANGWSIGFMDAVTAEAVAQYTTPEGVERQRTRVEPLTNYGVARVARDFHDGQSAVGGILTATNRRLEENGPLTFLRSAAYSGGVDGRHRFGGGNYEVRAALVGSHILGTTESITLAQRAAGRYFQRPDANHLEVDPNFTSLSGYGGNFFLGNIGGGNWTWLTDTDFRSPGFEVNDLGFQQQADEANTRASVLYDHYTPTRLFRQAGIGFSSFYGSTFGGERVQTSFDTNGFLMFRNLWLLSAGVTRNLEALSTTALRGGPAIIAPASTDVFAVLQTDRRRALNGEVFMSGTRESETGGATFTVSPNVQLRPSGRLAFSLGPSLTWNRDAWQYVAQPSAGDATRYVFANLDQRTVSLTARLDYTFSPELSLQLYAQPFLSAGAYDGFREAAEPRASRFDERLRPLSAGELRTCDGFYGVRGQEPGCEDATGFAYSFSDPDFNTKQFRSNAVLRWEYRPGSTLFVVWNQGRTDAVSDGTFDLRNDIGTLFGTPGTNVLLIKLSYWFGL